MGIVVCPSPCRQRREAPRCKALSGSMSVAEPMAGLKADLSSVGPHSGPWKLHMHMHVAAPGMARHDPAHLKYVP